METFRVYLELFSAIGETLVQMHALKQSHVCRSGAIEIDHA